MNYVNYKNEIKIKKLWFPTIILILPIAFPIYLFLNLHYARVKRFPFTLLQVLQTPDSTLQCRPTIHHTGILEREHLERVLHMLRPQIRNRPQRHVDSEQHSTHVG